MENSHLKISVASMCVMGGFTRSSSNRMLDILHRIYSYFVRIFFITVIFAECINLTHVFNDDFYHVIEIVTVFLLHFLTLCKLIICNSKNVQKLIQQIRDTERCINSYRNQDLENTYNYYVKWNHRMSKTFIYTATLTVLPFCISPALMGILNEPVYINETRNNITTQYQIRPLPIIYGFPFKEYRYHYYCYVYDAFGIIVGAGFTVAADLIFISIMGFILGQIKILQYSFKNINLLTRNVMRNVNISYDVAIGCTIKHCINMHQALIQYVKDLDTSMSRLMLIDFAVASMQMATLGLQMIVSGVGWQLLFAFEFLVAMLIQLFLFYWHANEIMLQSVEIATAIWESDWVEYSEEIKKSLMLVMCRSQKPLTLSVGPFYHMSTETALSILRAAYSYVAIIRQMYLRKS